ncbi:22184_t:CDS:2 [Gigaspora margarita]|uniref:22184_t:CDS:1 n=1 Tax=Gigaspora margarita TaxID=4874 RepID=A0ABN7UQ67_GIGMA|nr:22184_t:CDS:2 [Gigaspora margarita]
MSFKRHYQSYFIKWLLDQYGAEKDKKINVLGAIRCQDNKESFIDNNNDELIDELYTDIEVLNFPNMINLEEYINYPGIKIQINKMAQFEHVKALLKLQKEIKKLQIKAFKQTKIKTYFELVD